MTLVFPRVLGTSVVVLAAALAGCDSPGSPGQSGAPPASPDAALVTSTTAATAEGDATMPPQAPASDRPFRQVVPFVEDGRLWARSLLASSTVLAPPEAAVAADGSIVVGLMMGYAEGPASADFGGGLLDGVGDVDVVIGKLASDGNHLWSRRFGTAETDTLGGLAAAEDGSVIIAGSTEGPIDFGGGPLAGTAERSAYVAAFDADGRHQWSHRFEGSGSSGAASPQVLADGDIAVAGIFSGRLEVGRDHLEAAERQGFVARLAGDGTPRWATPLGEQSAFAQSLALDGASGDLLVLVGPSFPAQSGQTRLIRLSGAGEVLWALPLGPPDTVYARDLAVDQDGTILVTGAYHAPVSLGGEVLTPRGWDAEANADLVQNHPDAFLLRLSAGGEHLWSTSFGGSLADLADIVTVGADGDIYVAGESYGTFYLGPDAEGMQREERAGGFIARFAPDGSPRAAMLLETQRLGPLIVDSPATEDGEMLLGGRYYDALTLPFGGRIITDQWLDHFLARLEAP